MREERREKPKGPSGLARHGFPHSVFRQSLGLAHRPGLANEKSGGTRGNLARTANRPCSGWSPGGFGSRVTGIMSLGKFSDRSDSCPREATMNMLAVLMMAFLLGGGDPAKTDLDKLQGTWVLVSM